MHVSFVASYSYACARLTKMIAIFGAMMKELVDYSGYRSQQAELIDFTVSGMQVSSTIIVKMKKRSVHFCTL